LSLEPCLAYVAVRIVVAIVRGPTVAPVAGNSLGRRTR
jgi:hypothetical protein